MAVSIDTGRTKARAATDLVPIVLNAKGPEKVFFLLHTDGKEAGKETLHDESSSILHHSVVEGEGDAYTRLEGALKELNGLFKGMMLSGAVKDIHALVGVLEQDGMLHLSHAGLAEAYLIRDGSAAQITEFSRGRPTPSFQHIASGPLDSGDNVVLSTQRLLRTITPAKLAQYAQRGGDVLKDIISDLESEKEEACLLHITYEGKQQTSMMDEEETPSRRGSALAERSGSRRKRGAGGMNFKMPKIAMPSMPSLPKFGGKMPDLPGKELFGSMQSKAADFISDLRNPKRKRRAHLLLLAGAAGIFLVFWVIVQLSLATQRSQSREELAQLVEQITTDLKTAENRQLIGDMDSANAMLQRAEDNARKIMSNESGLYRGEALDLMDQIRQKQELINNIVRISPRQVVNLTGKNADVVAQGMVPVADGEFTVYDRQNLYRVLLNTVDDPAKLNDEELILDGTNFDRYQARAFMTTGNSLIEVAGGQPTQMKTDDASGWVAGVDMEAYLRFLYILLPDQNQIHKYERLNNRYGPSSQYNVNGDLAGALDMTIDGSVYILKEGGKIVKLFRGETRPFTIRNLPEGALANATKIFKSSENGNIYFLDPVDSRVIVVTGGGDLGESSYLKQYVLEGEQMSTLVDMWVNAEDSKLYVLDEKRLYSIDLQ